MEIPKLLSGYELVARGITKIDASLPENGLKDVVPNGSWLEQKQIQSALEARKNIIGVERIEKSGVLSHAEWREELMLAEVTRNVGGHWQFLGHNVGKQLYLKPEEALYLMEVNCLRLTHNDVTVSLQQAYSLLLRGKIGPLQYKVYASLSRIGYKVCRHDCQKVTKHEMKSNTPETLAMDLNMITSVLNTEEGNKVYEGNVPHDIEVETGEDASNEMDIIEDASVNTCNQETKTSMIDTHNILETEMLNLNGNTESNCTENRKISISNKESNDSNIMEVDGNGKQDAVNVNETECLNTAVIREDDNTKAKINRDEESNYSGDSVNVTRNDCTSNGEKINNFIDNTITNTENVVDPINKSTNDVTNSESNTEMTSENADPINETINVDNNSKLSGGLHHHSQLFYQHKIKKLENRKLRAVDWQKSAKFYDKIPDLSDKQIVMVDAPEDEYIPRKVFLNNISYLLNLENIKTNSKSTRPRSSESRSYSAYEEVNGDHIRRIKDTPCGNSPVTNPPLFPNSRFHRPPYQNPWRPNTNFFPYNFIFRSFLPNSFLPRFRVFTPRSPLLGMYPRFHSFQPNEHVNMPNVNKKRRSSDKQKDIHLEAIKNLAMRLRHLVQSGNTQQHNIDSLQRLINTFNAKYNMRLRLTDTFDVFNDETIIDTITLDEDEEPSSKRAKTDSDCDKYKENFNNLKQLAFKLKGLAHKKEITSRHRRAFSSLIKKFNKSYSADVYFNSNFEVIDRKFVNLDSSSDSDCVIEETAKIASKKKLKNPFNILKRLSEGPTLSPNMNDETASMESECSNYSKIKERFDKNWLPSEDDFGRVETLPKNLTTAYLIENKREEFLFEFLKSQPYEFDNWLDTKLSFLKSFEDTNIVIENDFAEVTTSKALVEPDDCTDMPSVLKKLSIIGNNKEIDLESSLSIDFDVYNRDVQNFRKTSRPTPHFRIICVSESSGFPEGKDVASLHSQYGDNVTIVFAVVGVGSISYLQINPIDLPVYIPSNDLP